MGNAPSNQPTPPTPPAPLSQIAPVCDSECQNAQTLAGLKAAMEQAETTRDSNPEGYEQARIAYFTALKGQGWLAEEKKRIADRDIKPVVTKYTDTFNSLTQQDKSQKIFVNLIHALDQESKQDSEDLKFLNKEFSQDATKANVLNRLAVLNQGTTASAPTPSSSLFSTLNILYALIGLLGLVVLYLLYSKFGVIKSYFGYSQPTILGGKRLPH